MSLLGLDFPSGQPGLYGTDATKMLDGLYTEANSKLSIVEDPSAIVTGNVLLFQANASVQGRIRRTMPTSGYTFGFACRLYLPGLPVHAERLPHIYQVRNISNVAMCTIVIETDGRVSAYRGSHSGTLLGTSTSAAAVANAWQHWECKIFCDAVAGTVEVRVEGVPVLNLTGQNTLGATGPITQVASESADSGVNVGYNFYMKDLVWWDTAGSLNNNFLGSIAVYELIPNADTALTWSLSSGSTGYSLVDEAPPVDTDYIYASDPPPAADKMSLTDLPVDVTSVKGLIAIVRSFKTDGGDGNLQIGLESNGDVGLGSDRPLTTTATYWADVFETDPDTSAAWTPAAVNDVEIQFDRTV